MIPRHDLPYGQFRTLADANWAAALAEATIALVDGPQPDQPLACLPPPKHPQAADAHFHAVFSYGPTVLSGLGAMARDDAGLRQAADRLRADGGLP